MSFLDTLYVVRREEAAAFGENLVLRVGQVLDYAVPTKIATYAPISASDGKAAEVWVTALPARFYEVRVRGWSVKFATGSGDEMRALAIALAKAAAEGMISPRNDDEQSEKPA